MNLKCTLALLLLVVLPATAQSGVKLGLGAKPDFGADGTIRVPIVLGASGPESIAALQLDFTFETAQIQFTAVEAGASALSAAKSAHANPLAPGTARVIIAGLNRNAIPEGIVAWVRFSPAPGAVPPFVLGVGATVLSDPYGNAVEVDTIPDTLTLDPGASLALTSDSGREQNASTGIELLLRYRALLFASVLVGGAVYLARRAPRKGRAR
jgi:hypothetical protein